MDGVGTFEGFVEHLLVGDAAIDDLGAAGLELVVEETLLVVEDGHVIAAVKHAPRQMAAREPGSATTFITISFPDRSGSCVKRHHITVNRPLPHHFLPKGHFSLLVRGQGQKKEEGRPGRDRALLPGRRAEARGGTAGMPLPQRWEGWGEEGRGRSETGRERPGRGRVEGRRKWQAVNVSRELAAVCA